MRALWLMALLAGCGGMLQSDPARFDQFLWQSDDQLLGGLSGLEVSGDGSSLTAISDRGYLFTAGVARQNGVITAMTDVTRTRLRATTGRGRPDTEGLAIGADGTIYISTEGRHGVAIEPLTDSRPTALPAHPDFASMQNNSSLEALAIDADGVLYTIPERSGRMTRPYPVYRYDGADWDIPFTIPRKGQFLVVGADIGPDGKFYVLERHFTGFGFQSRVRRFALNGSDEVEIMTSTVGQHDNLEGISVWQSGEDLRMTLVSDDNYRFLQRTELVEYTLPR